MSAGDVVVAASGASAPAIEEPTQTLYVQNLNEKVKKGALKKSLYTLFASHGRIVTIYATRTPALRGQAWVVFTDIASAAAAKRQLQGSPLYDRPLVRAPGSAAEERGGRAGRALLSPALSSAPSVAHIFTRSTHAATHRRPLTAPLIFTGKVARDRKARGHVRRAAKARAHGG